LGGTESLNGLHDVYDTVNYKPGIVYIKK